MIEVRDLGPIPLNVHKLRTTVDGRKMLRALGKWTEANEAVWAADRRRTKEKESKTQSGPFMAWDGEGATFGSHHVYTLLANSQGDYIESPTGLSTRECLEFLTDTAVRCPRTNHVIYGGSYDSNMILCDLSYYEIRDLVEGGHIYWNNREYRIEYRPRKELHIRRFNPEQWEKGKDGHYRPVQIASVILWDTIGFFQSRFVEAVKAWLPNRIGQLDFIESMKDKRDEFASEDPAEIRRYCILECEMLQELMTEFRNQCRWTGYVPTRWDGAGALGARILTKEGVRKHKSDGFRPVEVERAARFAYFGGRIEASRAGFYEGPVFGHDIVSAYPDAMRRLPCLAHGRWVRDREGYKADRFGVYLVRYNSPSLLESVAGRSRLFPLPVRKDGRVYFPPCATGWYWTPEVRNLSRFHPGTYHVIDGWVWEPECSHRPFGFVEELFDKRRRLKRNGHPAEKCLKLGLNSLYGKLAQQTGFRINRDGSVKPPPFHQLEWAGYITSATRARIYALAQTNPAAIVAFETDGVYSTEPLCHDDPTGKLGTWEVKEFGGICYVQSGVYWLKLPDGEWKAKYRGINRDTLTLPMVREGWGDGSLSVGCLQTRFHGMHLASVNPVTFTDWRKWLDGPKDIQLVPAGKRRHLDCWCQGQMGGEKLHLTVAAVAGDGVSETYEVSWGLSEWGQERTILDECFPDE